MSACKWSQRCFALRLKCRRCLSAWKRRGAWRNKTANVSPYGNKCIEISFKQLGCGTYHPPLRPSIFLPIRLSAQVGWALPSPTPTSLSQPRHPRISSEMHWNPIAHMESMGFEENYPSRLEWEAAGESRMAPAFWVRCLFCLYSFFSSPALGEKLVITVIGTHTAATPQPEMYTCTSTTKKQKTKKGKWQVQRSSNCKRTNEKNCLFSNYHMKPCGIKVTTNTIKGVKRKKMKKD